MKNLFNRKFIFAAVISAVALAEYSYFVDSIRKRFRKTEESNV